MRMPLRSALVCASLAACTTPTQPAAPVRLAATAPASPQDSNLQPPVLEPTPSNAGVAGFVDFQRLSFSMQRRETLKWSARICTFEPKPVILTLKRNTERPCDFQLLVSVFTSAVLTKRTIS